MIRVRLLILTYKREQMTRRCFDGISRIIDVFRTVGVDVEPLIGVDNEQNHLTAIEHGFEAYFSEPTPIGRRMNELMERAGEYDYLMQMGSDDFIDDDLCLILAAWMLSGAGMFGVNRMYIVNGYTGEVKRVSQTLVFGAGRCIRRDLVDKSLPLWEDAQCSGLDGQSQTKVFRSTGVGCVSVNTPRPMLYDVKSNFNINKWDRFERYPTVEITNYPPEIKHYLK
jgi:hypothetical protein